MSPNNVLRWQDCVDNLSFFFSPVLQLYFKYRKLFCSSTKQNIQIIMITPKHYKTANIFPLNLLLITVINKFQQTSFGSPDGPILNSWSILLCSCCFFYVPNETVEYKLDQFIVFFIFLFQVIRQEHLKSDMTTLLALCEKTDNDIRSCLNTLQVRSI